jgi:hypothetical protein
MLSQRYKTQELGEMIAGKGDGEKTRFALLANCYFG